MSDATVEADSIKHAVATDAPPSVSDNARLELKKAFDSLTVRGFKLQGLATKLAQREHEIKAITDTNARKLAALSTKVEKTFEAAK